MVSGRQRAARNWRRLGSDKKTWPTQWWRSGRQFEVMTSKWFRFEEAFIYAFMCYLFIYFFFENRRELSYMWSERLLVSVGGMFVCDSHEGRVRFDAGSASLGSGELERV